MLHVLPQPFVVLVAIFFNQLVAGHHLAGNRTRALERRLAPIHELPELLHVNFEQLQLKRVIGEHHHEKLQPLINHLLRNRVLQYVFQHSAAIQEGV